MAKKSRAANRSRWEKRMAKFEASNLSVVAFCKREKISAPSFYNWKRKLANQGDTMVLDEEDHDEESLDSLDTDVTASMELPGGLLLRVPIDHVGQVVAQLVGLK